MKSFKEFVYIAEDIFLSEAEEAQKAWQDWLNKNPSATKRGGRFYNTDDLNKAAREFMKTYARTGKAPDWAQSTQTPPSSGPKTQTPPPPSSGPSTQTPPSSGPKTQTPPPPSSGPKTQTPPPPPPRPGQTPPPSRPNVSRIPRPTVGQTAVGALNVGMGVLDYKARRDAGQTRTQAGSGAVSTAAGGQAGFMAGAKGGAMLGSRFGPKGALVGGVVGGIGGSILGSSGASALSDKLTGVNKTPTEKEYDKAKQKIGMTQSRQVASKSGVYGATKGSALTGTGGNTFTTKDAKGNAFMSTGTGSQRKTVQLAKTQLVRDPKTGQQRVGDLAFKGGKPVYLARASVASRDVGLGGALRNISRATGIGGQRQRDIAAAKQEYRTALRNTQAYTRGLGITTKSATKQGLPGYGGAKPAAQPTSKPTPRLAPTVTPQQQATAQNIKSRMNAKRGGTRK